MPRRTPPLCDLCDLPESGGRGALYICCGRHEGRVCWGCYWLNSYQGPDRSRVCAAPLPLEISNSEMVAGLRYMILETAA